MTWLKMDDPRLEEIKEFGQEIIVTQDTTFFYKCGKIEKHNRCTCSAQWLHGVGWVTCYAPETIDTDPLEIENDHVKSKVIRWQPMPEPFEGDV